MQEEYILVRPDFTLDNLKDWALQVTRAREDDILDYSEQVTTNTKIFTAIPTSSGDIKGTEKAGDIAVDTNFLYVVVNNSGTLQWQRVAISTF